MTDMQWNMHKLVDRYHPIGGIVSTTESKDQDKK